MKESSPQSAFAKIILKIKVAPFVAHSVVHVLGTTYHSGQLTEII